jgi:hypothetical protein
MLLCGCSYNKKYLSLEALTEPPNGSLCRDWAGDGCGTTLTHGIMLTGQCASPAPALGWRQASALCILSDQQDQAMSLSDLLGL